MKECVGVRMCKSKSLNVDILGSFLYVVAAAVVIVCSIQFLFHAQHPLLQACVFCSCLYLSMNSSNKMFVNIKNCPLTNNLLLFDVTEGRL